MLEEQNSLKAVLTLMLTKQRNELFLNQVVWCWRGCCSSMLPFLSRCETEHVSTVDTHPQTYTYNTYTCIYVCVCKYTAGHKDQHTQARSAPVQTKPAPTALPYFSLLSGQNERYFRTNVQKTLRVNILKNIIIVVSLCFLFLLQISLTFSWQTSSQK